MGSGAELAGRGGVWCGLRVHVSIIAGDAIGLSVRYQGELLMICDLQHRDPRRKSPPETEKSVGLL